ncbi:uncharacterized protein LOC110687712 [Chenopodium quinoa]|uniref:Retrotransposon Copia-like N-terminal domain-containing protein n=1 Tax=Chenopodium quinoa TaxID=63459 RepID=A0A803KQU0_CHEQI|nr:uncharacterized protein LOC110687712 [Chenopodium quinoa]
MAAQNHIPLPIGQDPSSPYYIHPFDMNSMQFFTNKFNGEGFTDWKRSMTIALSTKNKLGFVIDTTIARSVLYLNIDAEIWKDLEDIYGYTSGPQLYSIEQQLLDAHQNAYSIAAFFTKMKMLWDELNAASPFPICICNQ